MTWNDLGQQYGLGTAQLQSYISSGLQPDEISYGMEQGLSMQDLQAQHAQAQIPPETQALAQMAQIDPASEALRKQLAGSYAAPLAEGGKPSQGTLQSYLDLYGGIDPTGLAGRKALEEQLTSDVGLGSTLDESTRREIDQATLRAQQARGNVYGTPQLVEQAMTRGTAGLNLRSQRQQALQSYLSSGQDIGSTALGLYQTGLANQRAAQQQALSYLGSGQTPYQAGAGYLQTAENRAAAAAQGGPTYNPQGPSAFYTGAGASSFPQYGLDMSQLTGNWYNNINQANIGAYQAQTQRMMASQSKGGGMGGMAGGIGSALGGILGSIVPGVGTAIGGAVGGAVGSAAGSYFG